MHLREVNIPEFIEFAKNHELSNYAQTINYALFKGEEHYEFDLIGYYENDSLVAGAMILIKSIAGINYGYCPKGFLIDYRDTKLLSTFTEELKEYYYDKEVAFIKINPEVIVGNIDLKTYVNKKTKHYELKDKLISLEYNKLKDNNYFEALFPRFNAVVDLREYKSSNLAKNTKNKIKKGLRKGLEFNIVSREHLHYFNDFLNNDTFLYNDFYNAFSKDDYIDIVLITVDNHKYLQNSQDTYLKESDFNHQLNEKMIKVNSSKNINNKMNSDIALLSYKKDIMEATKLIEDKKDLVLAIALVSTYNRKAKVIVSAYDKNFKRYNANYFLYYGIIKHYSKTCDTLDLNGISGDFTSDSPYKGLNDFKLGFKPKLYEYIGEFDLVIEPNAYKYLLKHNLLAKEFSKQIKL